MYAGVHVTLESLVKDKELKTAIKDLVRSSGRSYPPSEEVEVQAASGKASVAPKQQFSAEQEKVPPTTQLNGISKNKSVAVA